MRAAQLHSDLDGLKASVDSMKAEAEEAGKLLAEQAQQAGLLDAQALKIEEQRKLWEEAIKARDEKIAELNHSLVATRTRLDEAIAKLKQAGAR